MAAFSIEQSFSTGWNQFKKHWALLLGILVITGLISGVFNAISSGISSDSGRLVAQFVMYVVDVIMSIILVRTTLAIIDEKPYTFSDAFGGLKGELILRYLGAEIVSGIAIGLGAILLVVPGVWFALRYSMVRYAVVDQGLGVFEALGESGRLTDGVKWTIFGFYIAAFIILLISMLPLFLGLLISVPVVTLAQASIYRQLKSGETKTEQPVIAANS